MMISRFRILFLIISSFLFKEVFSQDSIHVKIDSTHYQQITAAGQHLYPYNKKRVNLVIAGNIIGYGAVMIGLNSAWYSQYPRSNFHFFNDNAEWLQVDKAGHAYSAYIESRGSYEMWRWTGLSRKQRILAGGLSGVAYQSLLEIMDGFSAEYGFSWGDFAANVFGSSLFTFQEMAWDDQRIKMKFSFHERNYGQPDLNARANDLFGKTASQRFIKDYNATTDWVSVNIKSFLPRSNLPKWFAIAFGYGAEGLFGARSNIAKDKQGDVILDNNGKPIFDRSDVKRYRQWFIAPDVDLTRIHTNKKAIKILFAFLSSFKFPTPSIEFSNGSVKGHWIHF